MILLAAKCESYCATLNGREVRVFWCNIIKCKFGDILNVHCGIHFGNSVPAKSIIELHFQCNSTKLF